MSKTIWKYDLPVNKYINVPAESTVLCVQTQDDSPMLWILVDPSKHQVQRTFKTYGTGHDVPDNPGNYIGTFQMEKGKFVFHVFEEV